MTDLRSRQAIFAAKIEALHAEYIRTLRERRSNLQQILASIGDDSVSIEQAAELRPDIHKTAGTAASFGYRSLTRLAANSCGLIGDYSQYRTTSEDVMGAVDAFMEELDRVVENSPFQIAQEAVEN
jgi:HPt (histidine-containing phosphotransfer) domain-containing protein